MTDTTTDILRQADNSAAFGGSLMKVSLKNALPTGTSVSKAVIAIGPIRKEFENPTFPFYVNLDETETAKLNCGSQIWMAVWDQYGRKKTCKGSVHLPTQPRVV